jgi:maleylacetoacetate isomerase/maleylpyruvate isomerase
MAADTPVLYGYWRSTAAYRVRIALNLKGIAFENESVHLVRDGGEQHGAVYRALNPAGLVPALRIDGQLLTQSLAICEYLEETRPQPALLPSDPARRAWVRALALDVACDIHPLNNLRVQQVLRAAHGADEAGVRAWMAHWIRLGFEGIEAQLARNASGTACCAGDTPGLAVFFLVGQVYNAERFDCDLAPYPNISRITAHCRALPAFAAAGPERQADAAP